VPHDELLPRALGLARDITTADQRAARRLLRTYDEVTATTVDRAWDVERAVADAWNEGGLDTDEIERRRTAVVARGRAQL
jgi:hypothetical protein